VSAWPELGQAVHGRQPPQPRSVSSGLGPGHEWPRWSGPKAGGAVRSSQGHADRGFQPGALDEGPPGGEDGGARGRPLGQDASEDEIRGLFPLFGAAMAQQGVGGRAQEFAAARTVREEPGELSREQGQGGLGVLGQTGAGAGVDVALL